MVAIAIIVLQPAGRGWEKLWLPPNIRWSVLCGYSAFLNNERPSQKIQGDVLPSFAQTVKISAAF
jgi:hypothetical protein